jgi:hypothetical protein
VVPGDASLQLREHGIALLPDVFDKHSLTKLNEAATRCFQAIADGNSPPEHYGYSRSSHSVLLTALTDFGCDGAHELTAPLFAQGLERLFAEAIGPEWKCNMKQSWVRKKFAPRLVPASGYHLQNWHQDGALGVSFPHQPGPVVPMTQLLTSWIPLNRCGGVHSPGLEFIRRRQPALLHFTELADSALRERFSPWEFWSPELELGDGLVFLNDVLHRTFVQPEMQHNRLSVEYRIFPR